MNDRYETLYEILNDLKIKRIEIEKDLKIKEAGKRHNEVEHTLFGLGLAESIIMGKIDEIENSPFIKKMGEAIDKYE